jgi:hypothetical protein
MGRPRRRRVLLLAVVVLVALGVVATTEGAGGPHGRARPAERREPLPVEAGPEGTDEPRFETDGLVAGEAPHHRKTPHGEAGSGRAPSQRILVVGQLTGSNRLLAMTPDAVRKQARSGKTGEIEVQAASATVGGPLWLSAHGSDIVVVTTNHAQVVRLHADWQARDTLDVGDHVRLAKPLRFGPILAVSPDERIIAMTDDFHFALARIALDRWAVSGSRTYKDRSAAWPAACSVGPDVVVSTDGWLDRYDGTTLERVASTKTEGDWLSALACDGDAVYAVSSNGAYGWSFDARTLRQRARFEWRGASGGDELVLVDSQLIGTDRVAGLVFSCDIATMACRESEEIGNKPTNVVVDGDTVFVAVEDDTALALLDRTTLERRGSVLLPAPPRALLILDI